jgi:tRNA(Arg) A34 adenosine deaminase TadA
MPPRKDAFQHLIPYAQAQTLKHRTYAHVAVLLKGKRIVAFAANKTGSRSQGSGYGKSTLHAEVAVVKKLGDIHKLRGLTLVVFRYGPEIRSWTHSHPCKNCTVFLNKCMDEYGLNRVYYST